jgi:hypothetical protein
VQSIPLMPSPSGSPSNRHPFDVALNKLYRLRVHRLGLLQRARKSKGVKGSASMPQAFLKPPVTS